MIIAGALLVAACGEDAERHEQSIPATNLAGGETSEFGGDIPACPCGALSGPLMATITSIEDDAARVRVNEVLRPVVGVEVGSEVAGTWNGRLPCFVGQAAVAVGDEVLAFYWPSKAAVPGRLALTPWGDQVVLADATQDLIVSVADLPMLDAPDAECRSALGNISEVLGPNDLTP